jgi:hypothetical protein
MRNLSIHPSKGFPSQFGIPITGRLLLRNMNKVIVRPLFVFGVGLFSAGQTGKKGHEHDVVLHSQGHRTFVTDLSSNISQVLLGLSTNVAFCEDGNRLSVRLEETDRCFESRATGNNMRMCVQKLEDLQVGDLIKRKSFH